MSTRYKFDDLGFTRIYYELDGRKRHWDIMANPSTNDNTTLKQLLAEWMSDAIYLYAEYTEGTGKKWTYQ